MGQIVDISAVLLNLGLSSTVTEEERAIANAAIVRAEGAVKRYLKYDPAQRTRTEFYPQGRYGSGAREGVWEASSTQAYIRELSNAATSELQVQHIPIRSITSLSIDYDGRSGTRDGSFATTETEGDSFWPNYDGTDSDGNSLCRDGIIRSQGRWPTQPGTVKIVYVAGYTNSELQGEDSIIDASPISAVVVDEASRRVRKAFISMKQSGTGFIPGVLTGEKLGDYSYTIDGSIANTLFGGSWDLTPDNMSSLEDFVNYGWMLGG